jgi:hypothetical protein
MLLTHRFREQARSHIFSPLFFLSNAPTQCTVTRNRARQLI